MVVTGGSLVRRVLALTVFSPFTGATDKFSAPSAGGVTVAHTPAYRIWLVEDDHKLANLLAGELRRFGYEVLLAQNYKSLRAEFLAVQPDLILLDINLPQYDGFYWCRQIRTVSRVPIIFISARSDDLDQVRALENGGDDYITKPFNMELALAKVASCIRRTYGEYALAKEPQVLQIGELLLKKNRNQVVLGNTTLELTGKEFLLLWCLAEHGGEIVDRNTLLEALWDDIDFIDDNTLTVNVARVRRRLAELGLSDVIVTKRGQGYYLNVSKLGQPAK
jgi:two-component system OmpR family response regulator